MDTRDRLSPDSEWLTAVRALGSRAWYIMALDFVNVSKCARIHALVPTVHPLLLGFEWTPALL